MPTSWPTLSSPEWVDDSTCQLHEFAEQVARRTEPADFPYAAAVTDNILIYAAPEVTAAGPGLHAELVRALTDGPGVVVVEGAFDTDVVDAASAAFDALISTQHRDGAAAGDHFGAPGANERVWNAAQKLALAEPRVFAEYYANDVLATVSTAWLGPRYAVTSQVNVVNPGGKAQVPHRDYHLGFVGTDELAAYPAHIHRLSPALTLQGAVAHCDMPIESGPTMLLPHSQRFLGGYVAFRRPEFVDFFAANHVQLPMRKGDALFFNPALYHGAGANTSAGLRRMANLLQISSAFGRPMETVDRTAMTSAVYPALLRMKRDGRPERQLRNVVAATADAYPFPTNLDRDPPIGDLAPPSQADTVLAALADDMTPAELDAALRHQDNRRTP